MYSDRDYENINGQNSGGSSYGESSSAGSQPTGNTYYQNTQNQYSQSQYTQQEYTNAQNTQDQYAHSSQNGYDGYSQNQNTGSGHGNHSKKAKKSRGSGAAKMIAVAVICALIGGLAGAGASSLINSSSASSSENTTTIQNGTRASSTVVTSEIDTSTEMTAAEVYATYVNSTVGITTTITTNYFGYETTSAASGSGFIISSDGYIVTNYHVIEDSSDITVSLYDGTSYDAELIGYDEDNDLAILKIEATDLTPVVLGDSDNMNVGDEVIAIGNPLGELTFSLTEGVISALNRSVTMSTGTTMNLIQTDCAINSGNSGGALFNMYGEVIGITNAKYSSSSSSSSASIDNIGFAIPISSVKDIITSIIETGTVETTYIGVTITDMTMDAAASSGVTSGAVIQSVTEGAPADEAGLQAGDVITMVNDTEITGSSDLVSVVGAASAGDELVCTVYRDGEVLEITVTVGTQSTSALPEEETEVTNESYEDDSSNSSGSFPWGNGSGPDGNGDNGSNGYGGPNGSF